MTRLQENPSSDQTPSQPPPQSNNPHLILPSQYPVPQSSLQTQFQPSQIHPPQQHPTAYQPQAQPAAYAPQAQPAAYPPQAQPAAYPPQAQTLSYQPQPSLVANPQMYGYTHNNCQPQGGYYGVTPVYQPPVQMSTQQWSTGLLECHNDPENAIVTFCFPCVTFGQIAEIADNGQTSCGTSALLYSLILAFIGIPCIMSCSYRTKIRSRFNLLETPAPDWIIHLCCEYCALCQEYRELKHRGMDPALGWQGYLLKQQQMANCATMNPPIHQRMMG